jgi:hypothetical protein
MRKVRILKYIKIILLELHKDEYKKDIRIHIGEAFIKKKKHTTK